MSVIRAVFENGVLRPLVPLDLPEHSEVEFEPLLVTPQELPASNAENQARPRSALIGLFADEPELMDRVMESVNELRERPWRLEE